MFETLIVIYIMIWFIIAVVISDDAKKRGKSSALWFFIVFLFGLLGLILWFIVRPPLTNQNKYPNIRICTNCGRSIPLDAKICPYCGHTLNPPESQR